jgi:hypothetical protein
MQRSRRLARDEAREALASGPGRPDHDASAASLTGVVRSPTLSLPECAARQPRGAPGKDPLATGWLREGVHGVGMGVQRGD